MEFFDTRRTQTINLAVNIISNPFEFLIREKNQLLVSEAVIGPINQLIEIVSVTQKRMRDSNEILQADNLWDARKKMLCNFPISTQQIDLDCRGKGPSLASLDFQLNQILIEGLVEEVHRHTKLRKNANALRLHGTWVDAVKCVWLSDVLALLVLGIARFSDRSNAKNLYVVPVSKHTERNLRSLWFANEFEQLSIRYANVKIGLWAEASCNPETRGEEIRRLEMDVLYSIALHWRFGGEKLFLDFSHSLIWPIMRLLREVKINSGYTNPKPISRADAIRVGAQAVFDHIVERAALKCVVDSLFLFNGEGLLLGDRLEIRGIIELAEEMASKVCGVEWHDWVSDAQESYVIDRLRKNPKLEIYDFQLTKDHTIEKVAVDVDFWVKDLTTREVFAIQIKHFLSNKYGGLKCWLRHLRSRGKGTESGLAKGVAQIENVRFLVRHDAKVRAHLQKNGLGVDSLNSIHPVLLHNHGSIDFMQLQEGVLLYDTNTFCNLLDRRKGVAMHLVGARAVEYSVFGAGGKFVKLSDPESVIKAYIFDENIPDLRDFDLAQAIRRSFNLGPCNVSADGFGI